jgi:Disulphide bond corrector protein DsbC
LAQISALSVGPPEKVTAKRGGAVEVKTRALLKSGYHVNSNTPSESYLIPLRLTWEPGPLEAAEVVFPKAHMEKYEFSPNPLSVFTGDFELVTKFKVAANASAGPAVVLGKLRYQACSNNACLPPRTIEIKLPVIVQ